MKLSVALILGFCIVLSSCTSQKKIQEETPFEVNSPSCRKWVGGKEQSGSGMEVKFPVSFPNESTVEIKEVFFRGKQADAVLSIVDGQSFVIAKMLNTQVASKETNDFKLKSTDAVMSYIENNTLKYAKITGIKEKQALLYKGRPKN